VQRLKGSVAVVAGASRGAGRGIALALGEAGATVYVTGRTVRGGPPPPDGAPGTVEDTADEVTARGGVGIPVRVDHTAEADVAALFERVRAEQGGRLDVLANAVWGGNERYMEDVQTYGGRPFWEQPLRFWPQTMVAGPYAYLVASCHAARLMAARHKGLIVHVTDGIDPDGTQYRGQLFWDLSHECINRMVLGMSLEAKSSGIAVVALNPGFMRTERVVRALQTEELKRAYRFDRSESPEYVGRAAAALAADPKVLDKTGRLLWVADLAQEYGFTDVDGRYVPRFNPHG
jgi:NAD(P)-dependent dehydrogenase (short-subunit alcohol dehydrogenase family)